MKTIITFISQFSPAFDPCKPADEYTYSGGSVEGRQTNEAPVKYLLHQDPDIDWVICICTKQVLHEKRHGITAYQYFQSSVQENQPNVMLVPIHFFGEDFAEEVIPEILKYIGPDDEIYLDTTGGPRNAVSQLILLSQVLRYQGNHLLQAVYSNYQTRKIEDVTGTYEIFDLISGLNEFRHHCSTELIEKYFEGNAQFKALLQAMKDLSEAIILCRTRTGILERRIKNFNQVLRRIQSTDNPMLQVLLPIFEAKFASLHTIPDVIRWCLDNNMILQALTIFNDCIPEYMIRERGILTYPEQLESRCDTKQPYVFVLTDLGYGFFSLGGRFRWKKDDWNYIVSEYSASCALKGDSDGFYKDDLGVRLVHNLTDASFTELHPLFGEGSSLEGFHVNISREKMQAFCFNYMQINLLRNHLNHDGGEMVRQKSRIWYMTQIRKCKPLERIDSQYVKNVVYQALDQISMD